MGIFKRMKTERNKKVSQVQPLWKLNWIAIDRRWSIYAYRFLIQSILRERKRESFMCIRRIRKKKKN